MAANPPTPQGETPGSNAWWFARAQEHAKLNARRALELAKQETDRALAEWDTLSPVLLARCARLIAQYGSEACVEAGALKVLEETAHLVVPAGNPSPVSPQEGSR